MQASGYREQGDYIFMGHSLGGYLGAHFAIKYPQNITELILMSPVGVPNKPPGYDLDERIEKMESATQKFFFKRAVGLWRSNWAPA